MNSEVIKNKASLPIAVFVGLKFTFYFVAEYITHAND